MRTTMLAALAALLPCAAWAAPAPLAANGIPVDPEGAVHGSLGQDGAQTWRLHLQRGGTYAVWGATNGRQTVTVSAAGGRVLAGFPLADGDDQPEGASLAAPYSGLYFVTVTGQGDYSLSAGRDCPGDTSTRCWIGVGQTVAGEMRFAQDSDWLRTRLKGGTTYRVDLSDTTPGDDCSNGALVSIRDGGGVRLAWAEWSCAPGPALVYTPPADGPYYVVVQDDGGTPIAGYSLGLAVNR